MNNIMCTSNILHIMNFVLDQLNSYCKGFMDKYNDYDGIAKKGCLPFIKKRLNFIHFIQQNYMCRDCRSLCRNNGFTCTYCDFCDTLICFNCARDIYSRSRRFVLICKTCSRMRHNITCVVPDEVKF
jgi:hypothetical protein